MKKVIFILSWGDGRKTIGRVGRILFILKMVDDRNHSIHLEATMSDEFRTEEFSVNGEQLLAKVKELLREGNIRRVIIKDKSGKVLVEFPLTVGVVGVALAPVLAAIGALAALVSEATIAVEKT